jgi:hypothetical protein
MVTATNVTFLTVAIYLLDLAIKVVALGLVPEGRRPSSATAWLLLILFLPVIGLLAFWLIGSPFVDRGRRRQQAAAGEVISGALTAEANDLLPVPAGSTLNTLVVLNRRLGWLPSVGGNKAELFSDYDESIAAMAREIRTAKQYVHVEFYIMSFCHGLVPRDRRGASGGRAAPSVRAGTRRCGVPGGAQWTGFSGREQPAIVQLADLRRATPAFDHQPVLRAR